MLASGVSNVTMSKRNYLFRSAAACLASATLASAAEISLSEFSKEDNEKLGWGVVDDGVMGGLSKGKLAYTDQGTLVFSGDLSLENNGGFSSLRTRDLDLDLSASDGLLARVKGDGRTYQVRLASDARYRGMEVSFMAEFATEKDQWIEVRVPFEKLVGSWRGRSLAEEVFNPSSVQRLGLILSDKNPGPFRLEVDWLRTYSGTTGDIVETALADGRFKTLAAALKQAQLLGALRGDGPFTVFAPSDEAFAKLPKGAVEDLLKPENLEQLQAILKYHVIPAEVTLAGALQAAEADSLQGESVAIAFADGRIRVNEALISDADIRCSNGIIHVIDAVLLPPSPKVESARTDILGVAKSAGTFNTLIAAVGAAGLADVLGAQGPFTVFAPTDAAFSALPAGTVDSLLEPQNLDQLKAILSYHVIGGRVSAGDALNAGSAESLGGGKLKFAIEDGSFKVNAATVRSIDIVCDNGMIHIIDSVLIPPASADGDSSAVVSPAAMIEAAIDRGVPAFNRGDHAGCAKIYQVCLEEIAADERVGAKIRKTMTEALAAAGKVAGDRDRAWLFRHALDHAYHAVSE